MLNDTTNHILLREKSAVPSYSRVTSQSQDQDTIIPNRHEEIRRTANRCRKSRMWTLAAAVLLAFVALSSPPYTTCSPLTQRQLDYENPMASLPQEREPVLGAEIPEPASDSRAYRRNVGYAIAPRGQLYPSFLQPQSMLGTDGLTAGEGGIQATASQQQLQRFEVSNIEYHCIS